MDSQQVEWINDIMGGRLPPDTLNSVLNLKGVLNPYVLIKNMMAEVDRIEEEEEKVKEEKKAKADHIPKLEHVDEMATSNHAANGIQVSSVENNIAIVDTTGITLDAAAPTAHISALFPVPGHGLGTDIDNAVGASVLAEFLEFLPTPTLGPGGVKKAYASRYDCIRDHIAALVNWMMSSGFTTPVLERNESVPLTKFTCFMDLPLEIRENIWLLALPDPRVFMLRTISKSKLSSLAWQGPSENSILAVNQESRRVCIGQYYKIEGCHCHREQIFLDFKKDIFMCLSHIDSDVIDEGLTYHEVNLNDYDESVLKKSICRIVVRLILPNEIFWEENKQVQKDIVKHYMDIYTQAPFCKLSEIFLVQSEIFCGVCEEGECGECIEEDLREELCGVIRRARDPLSYMLLYNQMFLTQQPQIGNDFEIPQPVNHSRTGSRWNSKYITLFELISDPERWRLTTQKVRHLQTLFDICALEMAAEKGEKTNKIEFTLAKATRKHDSLAPRSSWKD